MFRPKFLTVKLSFFIIATTFILTPLFGDERSDQRNAERVAQQMTREDFASCVPYFSPELQTFWTASELANQWKSGTRSSGELWRTTPATIAPDGSFVVDSFYEKKRVRLAMTFGPDGKITDFSIIPLDTPDDLPLPEGLEERDLLLNAGTEWELPGTLTTRKGKKSPIVAILIQGAGPHNRNETVFANAPFRDIAWGLAASGVDVFRYDKRTNIYPEKFAQQNEAERTVREETILDAIAAAKLLVEKEGYSTVWLIGHSLGGTLAPRIAEESGQLFHGLVIMTASPRSLFDALIDQSELVTANLGFIPRQVANRKIEGERQRWLAIQREPDAQTFGKTLFDQSAYYFKESARHDTAALAQKFTGPVLVLYGGGDIHLKPQRDFDPWKTIFAKNSNTKFILYDQLNHLLVPIPANSPHSLDQYKIPGRVSERVIADIASFIDSNSPSNEETNE